MSDKFKKFIVYVKNTYKTDFGVNICFPTFSEMTSYHSETLLRLNIEAKFFDITDDIDSLVMLSHLCYLNHISYIKRLTDLYIAYTMKSSSIKLKD